MSHGIRHIVKLSVGVIAALVFSWLAFRHLEWQNGWHALAQTDPFWLLFGLCLLATGYAMRIVRWWLMLRFMAPGLRLTACPGPFLSSIALNNVLPFRAGDVMRTLGFRRQIGLPGTQVLGTIVLERFFDLTVLLLVFLLGLVSVTVEHRPGILVKAAYWLTGGFLGAMMLLFCTPLRLERFARRLAEKAAARKFELAGLIGTGAAQFFSSLSLARSPRLTVQLLMLSFGAWFMEGAMFASVAQALGISHTSAGPWFALATGNLGTLIPSTPGYVGTFDYFTMVGLAAYQVPSQAAALFALVVHLMLWLPLTLIGLLWLASIKSRKAAAMDSARTIGAAT